MDSEATRPQALTVGRLEEALLARFPLSDAEPWDRVGISVGDPCEEVRGVACALDVTPQTIRAAAKTGANVLLTHHPVYLEMPARICPQRSGAATPASSIWEAVESRVSLIALHTNLDRSLQGSLRMPELLGLRARPGLERGRGEGAGRYGSVCDLGEPTTLDALALRCRDAFGRVSQVFGDGSRSLSRVGFFTGSVGSSGCEDAVAAGLDCVVCGECGYHRALDLDSVGVAVIILGHDASELPLVSCLRDAALGCGVEAGRVFVVPEPRRWHCC